jgi:hypothetical protein
LLGCPNEGLLRKASFIHYLGCPTKASLGRCPINAAIGDRHPIIKLIKRSGKGLAAGMEVAFDHHGMDAINLLLDLGKNVFEDRRLTGRVFFAVGMTAIDHDGHWGFRFFKSVPGG